MSDRLSIPHCSNIIADAMHRALKSGLLTKYGIDEIRGAVVGYLTAGQHILTSHDAEKLVEATVRKVVEKVG